MHSVNTEKVWERPQERWALENRLLSVVIYWSFSQGSSPRVRTGGTGPVGERHGDTTQTPGIR